MDDAVSVVELPFGNPLTATTSMTKNLDTILVFLRQMQVFTSFLFPSVAVLLDLFFSAESLSNHRRYLLPDSLSILESTATFSSC